MEQPPTGGVNQPGGATVRAEGVQASQAQTSPTCFERLDRCIQCMTSRGYRTLYQFLMLFCLIALLIGACFSFRGTWGRECDYYQKVWSIVWIVRSIVHWTIIVTVLNWRRLASGLLDITRLAQVILGLFKFAWWLYGIKPIFVDPTCDNVSYKWALSLWLIDVIVGFLPYLCVCLLIPLVCILSLSGFGPTIPREDWQGGHSSGPTPKVVRDKLKIVKYSSVQSFLEHEYMKSVGRPQPSPQDQPQSTEEPTGLARHLPSIASAIIGVPLPNMTAQLMRLPSSQVVRSARSASFGRLSSEVTRTTSQGPPLGQVPVMNLPSSQVVRSARSASFGRLSSEVTRTTSQSPPLSQVPEKSEELPFPLEGPTNQAATVIGESVSIPVKDATRVSCPVCYCEFEPSDDVIQLPCDRRHAFHKDCLFAWLDNARICPVCRADVEEGLKDDEQTSTGKGITPDQNTV